MNKIYVQNRMYVPIIRHSNLINSDTLLLNSNDWTRRHFENIVFDDKISQNIRFILEKQFCARELQLQHNNWALLVIAVMRSIKTLGIR